MLNQAKEAGVHPFLDNGKLRLKVNKDQAPHQDLLTLLRQYREEITGFLLDEADHLTEIREQAPRIAARSRAGAGDLPLSFAQERLWFIDRLEGSQAYHMPVVLRIAGNLDPRILEKAFREIINRHEVLRTTLVEKDGTPFQRVQPAGGWTLGCPAQPISGEEQERIIRERIARPFDLAKDHMLRADLFKTTGGGHLLVMVMHHVASDDWSMPIIVRELVTLYQSFRANRPSPLPPLPVQYADYAVWQRQYLSGSLLEKKLGYWERKLRGMEPLRLPADGAPGAVAPAGGNTRCTDLGPELSRRLKELSNRAGVTPFMTLLAAFKVLLYRYTDQEDICVGTPIANRAQPEITPLVGFFVNMLPVRSTVAGKQPFTALLAEVKRTVLEAYDHQDVPFEKIVERASPERSLGGTPLFGVVFAWLTSDPPGAEPPGEDEVTLSAVPFENGNPKFDLTLTVEDRPEGLQLNLECRNGFLGGGVIDRTLEHYRRLLAAVVAEPDRPVETLNLLSPAEENRLLAEFNDTAAPYPADTTVVALFERQARQWPGNVAVRDGAQSLTYGELDEKATRLARHLRDACAVQPGALIGIMTHRSSWMVVAILGVLKAGAAYVPIGMDYPPERKSFILEDAGLRLVLVESEEASLPDHPGTAVFRVDTELERLGPAASESPLAAASAGDLAYVIYTSGSTGRPKGVMVEHRSLVNLCCFHTSYYQVTRHSRGAMFAEPAFDASVWETHPYLVNGATLCPVRDNDTRHDTARLQAFILDQEITHIFLPTQVCLDFISNKRAAGKATILTGGEALVLPEKANLTLFNNYGPTETTVITTVYRVEPGETGSVPIGKPITNTRAYILGKAGGLMPQGLVGELCIAGDGVARGYLNGGGVTEEKFVQDPFMPGVMYRTGDLARWRPDGNLEYRGRLDDQVKIRGFRIEPGEIETVLSRSAGVSRCVVTAPVAASGSRQLVAYVVPAGDFDEAGIRQYLGSVLPPYMIPGVFIPLDGLPHTDSGKVDKKRLPAPGAATLPEKQYAPARNQTEQGLVEIWQEVLNAGRVGVFDNFFEVGGHSLLAAKVMARIGKVFSVRLPISALLTHPTISALAGRIAAGDGQGAPPVVAMNAEGTKPPVFCAPPGGGNVIPYYELARALGADQPLYAFQAPGADAQSAPLRSVPEMAKVYIAEMQKISPEGPYTLAGYSFGGGVIYEMALQLTRSGFGVKQLIVFDALAPDATEQPYDETLPATYTDWLLYFKDVYNLAARTPGEQVALDRHELAGKPEAEQLALFHGRLAPREAGLTPGQLKAYMDVYMTNASISYVPDTREPLDVPVVLFRGEQTLTAFTDEQVARRNEMAAGKAEREDLGWRDFTTGRVDVYPIPCNHINMMEGGTIALMIEFLNKHLN